MPVIRRALECCRSFKWREEINEDKSKCGRTSRAVEHAAANGLWLCINRYRRHGNFILSLLLFSMHLARRSATQDCDDSVCNRLAAESCPCKTSMQHEEFDHCKLIPCELRAHNPTYCQTRASPNPPRFSIATSFLLIEAYKAQKLFESRNL